MRNIILICSGLLGVLFLATSAIAGGMQFEEYSHVRQFMSETYAKGTAWGDVLRFGGFVPAGSLFLLFGLLCAYEFRRNTTLALGFLGFGSFYGLGTILAALWPCEFGCDPELTSTSTSQMLHFTFGSLTYMVTPFCFLAIGLQARKHAELGLSFVPMLAASVVMGLGVIVLFAALRSDIVGLSQRFIEASALVFVLVVVRDQYRRTSTQRAQR